jgi:hypothetical protein
MGVGHADEATAAQRRLTTLMITEREVTDHSREPDVKLMAVTEQLHVGEPYHVPALDTQLEDQPVRQVDKVLVEHGQPAQDRRLAVVTAVHVGAGIVHAVGVLPLRHAACAQVTVARRGQRLAKALSLRIKAFIREQETVHGTPGRPGRLRGHRRWAGRAEGVPTPLVLHVPDGGANGYRPSAKPSWTISQPESVPLWVLRLANTSSD